MTRAGNIGSAVLLLALAGIAGALALWRQHHQAEVAAASANQPEPTEVLTVATATEREHRRSTTAIGTVRALRSITLRNELPGTVRQITLVPGQIVDEGTVLVALDVSVEEAELRAQEAQAALTEALLGRMQKARENRASSEADVDRARAERDVALAQIGRTRAIIARKTITAPFRARVGMADLHRGQYLEAGTQLTTLQGVDAAVHVDFAVAQNVAAMLHEGDPVQVLVGRNPEPVTAKVIAVDARVDQETRNAWVRALLEGGSGTATPSPGASVRVRVPIGAPQTLVAVPVSALRKSPAGDHVFVVTPDKEGKNRVHERNVHTAALVDDEVLLLDGLKAGEQVAVSGSFKLREAALVSIAKDAGPDGGK